MAKQVLGPGGEVWATAPDESWNLRSEPWPEIALLVEVCWSSRRKTPPSYAYSRGRLIRYEYEGVIERTSTWANERGETLAFNPDFWRPIDYASDAAAEQSP
jgi:hypothetical protein